MVTKSSSKPDGKKAPASRASSPGSLDAYRGKRVQSRTNEPFAAERITSDPEPTTGLFVVHLHDARRRHWDLRLQIGATLASFAVPKGPSLDPKEKRLAVHTEDHPLDYADFEDVIPEGNYGAGAMIAWDMGRVRWLEPPMVGFDKGKLDFVLSGFKLGGRFALVRTGGRPGRAPSEKNQWLLIKKEDAFSSAERDILAEAPESVLSGLRVEELAGRTERAARIEARAGDLGAPLGQVDGRKVVPMKCGAGDGRLDDPARLYELKLDGVRLLADRRGDDVTLSYRSQRIMTASYPEVVRAVRALSAKRVVLDGEVVAFDAEGRPSFARLGRRMHLTRPHDVAHAAAEVPVVYLVFDVLQVGERDVRSLPLRDRKTLLAELAPRRGIVRLLDHLEGDGRPLDAFCREMGLEGVVGKRTASPYRAGPDASDDWIKIKREREADFVVVGWVEGKGGRKGFGALEVASYEGERLVLRSRVGSGLDAQTIARFGKLLAPLEVAATPAQGEPEAGGGKRHFARPEIVVNVVFAGWSEHGGLRHPVFRGIRDDRSPHECTAAPPSAALHAPPPELPPQPVPELPPGSPPGPRPREKVKVTNRSKVFWPDEGYTKGELVDYYRAIAPAMLPFLAERPIVLVRYPDGIAGKSFFQWNVPEGTPSWLRTLHLPDEEGGPGKTTFVVDDVDGLTYVANLGCIPIHVLPFRAGSREECDYIVFDLDLGPRPFQDGVTLALSLRELLDDLGLTGFPKTSGQSGIHVLAPLGPGIPFDTAKTLVELVGRLLQARHADIATMERRVSARGERALIDIGQTGRSRTIVGPYSVRAKPGATVSLPLRWEEVHRALDPREHSMFTVPGRVAEYGDALSGFFEARPDIPAVITRLGKMLGV